MVGNGVAVQCNMYDIAKWSNGLSNALRDMPTEWKERARLGSIIIEIHDEGRGISAANQTALFGEGVQFDPNDLQAGQGISYRICSHP